jgi:phage terminase large subunit-like protein
MTARDGKLAYRYRKARKEGWADWIHSEADELAMLDGCWFDLRAAEHAWNFFPRFLKHSKGRQWAHKPFELLPWQRDYVIGPLFGWKRKGGTRRYRTAYIEIPKKNGKSTLAAGVGLYLLVADGEPGSEVFSTATSQKQALIVHDEAVHMIRSSPALSKRLKLNLANKIITDEPNAGKYAAMSAEGKTSEGVNAHGLICDEMHVWTSRATWDAIMYAGVNRDQPVKFLITTAGIHDTTSIGWEQHEYAIKVRDGAVTNHEWLVYIRAADQADITRLDDPEVHKKANPSYGVTINPDEMERAAQQAKERPTEVNTFLRYRLNIWVSQTERVIDMIEWDACDGRVDEDELEGRKCFGGLDLASKRDLAACALLFPPFEADPIWRLLLRIWVPADNAAIRESKEGAPYVTWGRQGHLTLTPGNSIDYEVIRQQLMADRDTFDIRGIAADQWNLEYLRQRLDPEGEWIVEFGQTVKNFSEPMKNLIDVLLPKRTIAHGGHPVARWCAQNLEVWRDGNGNIRPSKKNPNNKIDPLVATIMALGRAMLDVDDGSDICDERSFLVL